MEVESFLLEILATAFLISHIFAEADITMSHRIDDPGDPVSNYKSPALSDNYKTVIEKPDQKENDPGLQGRKTVKAYSAVMLIKPVKLDSDWKSEFSSIISDNLVAKDSDIKKRPGFKLKKLIRESETSNKLVVIPIANSITSLQPLVNIIKKRIESSIFPKKMVIPKLEGVPKLIRMIPRRRTWREMKNSPKIQNKDKDLDSTTELNSAKESTAFQEKMIMPKLEGVPELIKAIPRRKTWREMKKSQKIQNEDKELDSTTEINLVQRLINTMFSRNMMLQELEGIPELFRKIPSKKTWQQIRKSLKIRSKDNEIDTTTKVKSAKDLRNELFSRKMAMPELGWVSEFKIMIPSRKTWQEIKKSPKTPNKDKEIDSTTKINLAKESDFISITEISNEEKKSLTATLPRKYAVKSRQPSTELLTAEGKNLIDIPFLTDEKKFTKPMKKLETESTGNVVTSLSDIEIIVDKSNSNTTSDINAYEISNNKISNNSQSDGVPQNLVFLRLFPQFKPNQILKRESGSHPKHSNLVSNSKRSTMTGYKPRGMENLNELFNWIIKTERIPVNENIIKFKEEMNNPTGNALQNYPPNLILSPVHFLREVMRVEDMPEIKRIPDKKQSMVFQRSLPIKSKNYPIVIWGGGIFDDFKEAIFGKFRLRENL